MPPCGTALSDVDGIYSYSNGADEATGESCAGQASDGTYLYQCVEFAERYFHERFGVQKLWAVGAAADMCNTHPSGTSVHDISGYQPKHGDLIVWQTGTFGHVAVVKSASGGSITIVEQNGGWSTSGSRTLSADDNYRSAGCFVSADANTETAVAAQSTNGTLSAQEIAHAAHGAGVACGDNLTTAVAVAMGESGGVTSATHVNDDGSVDRGLWQVNSGAWPNYTESCLFDASCNAGAMMDISGGGTNWNPWVVYTTGAYQQYLSEASAAAASECSGASAAAPSDGSCESLGYYGTCVGQTSIWFENGQCRVRDCASEGRTCGLISADAGLGCSGGNANASTVSCTSIGAAGKCMNGTKVWSDGGQCRWQSGCD
jgi:surface antigen